jgi:hypothetical protein
MLLYFLLPYAGDEVTVHHPSAFKLAQLAFPIYSD